MRLSLSTSCNNCENVENQGKRLFSLLEMMLVVWACGGYREREMIAAVGDKSLIEENGNPGKTRGNPEKGATFPIIHWAGKGTLSVEPALAIVRLFLLGKRSNF